MLVYSAVVLYRVRLLQLNRV